MVPANDAVIHKNVLAYTSSVAAATLRRVQRLRQPRLSVRLLALVPCAFSSRLLLDRIASHPPLAAPSPLPPAYGLGGTRIRADSLFGFGTLGLSTWPCQAIGAAVLRTAPILVLTRRYSSGLLNFAVYSPEDAILRASNEPDRRGSFRYRPAASGIWGASRRCSGGITRTVIAGGTRASWWSWKSLA